MHTLFDYLTHTKAIAYVVAFALLAASIPFWKFLTEREEGESPLHGSPKRRP